MAFGPHPRSYRKTLPRRMRRHALRCVLSDKARSERIVCLNSMDGIDGKTRSMKELLERLNVPGSALIVTMDSDQDVVRAAGNLQKVYTLPVNQLNAEALLSRDTLILTVAAARWAEETLAGEPHGRRGRKFAADAAVETATAENGTDDQAVESVSSESVATATVTSDTDAEGGE